MAPSREVPAHAGDDVVDAAREATPSRPPIVQPTTVEVELVGDARDDRVGVADGRPEERRAASR